MAETYVVHYSEVALKGKNRPDFIRHLRRNIRRSVRGLGETTVGLDEGRFMVESDADPEEVCRCLSTVFGVAWFARTSVAGPTYEDIRDHVIAAARPGLGRTFRIDARRTHKSFPLGSMEMERRLGAEVVRETGRRVNLSDPEESIHVDVMRGKALVYSSRRRGPGGLPVGTSGRVMHLFSGGIDSPVAAWLLMKRGCTPIYLHFYLAPTPTYPLESKVLRLVKILSAYSGKSTLLLVPFADYQLSTAGAPADLEPSLFRRFMRVTAEVLAPLFGASAISTGDCLAQAASQTVWNLAGFDVGSSLPILRPLLTYDKDEVIRLAERLGTYGPAIEEYKDCCAIVTRHPRTRVKHELVSRYFERLRLAEVVRTSVSGGTLAAYNPDTLELKTSLLEEVAASRSSQGAVPPVSP
ncbi:MAG TPA: tRNA uracil 4-sulfurtransferase ThiI [Nitrososphaerales archaeon]|nr:tRNA uracil 4-sulfurtransferase ThiI [Nitrososphaerales archaeon]